MTGIRLEQNQAQMRGKKLKFENSDGLFPKSARVIISGLFLFATIFVSPILAATEGAPVPQIRPGSETNETPVPEIRPDQSNTVQAVEQEQVAANAMAMPALRPSDPPPPTKIVSEADYYATQNFISLLDDEVIVSALSIQETIVDPLARDIAEWLYLRGAVIHASPERIGEFVTAHPIWPELDQIRVRQEGAFYLQNITPDNLPDLLAPHQPISDLGKIVLARWNVAQGNPDAAAELVDEVWQLGLLSRSLEDKILAEFSDFIDASDHRIRARRLYYRGRTSAAARIVRLVGNFGNQLFRAYGAVGKRSASARKIMTDASESVHSDPLIVLRKAQAKRRRGDPVAAAEILLESTPENQHLTDARGWWPERRLLVRRVLLEGRPDLALGLAAGHNNPPGIYYAEGEFLAGWVALRHKFDPEIALHHFTRLRAAVTSPLSVSRAEYWLGRAEQTRGNSALAIMHFTNAARYQYTYYGQLAALEADQRETVLGDNPAPTPADAELFDANELSRAARLFADLGEFSSMQKFLVQIGRVNNFDPEIILAAQYAENLGRADIALRIGKAAIIRDRPQIHAAFTLAGLPEGFDDNRSLEPALTYAIARQESAFLQTAVSRSGARGLLQLMPATAREVATGLQLPYNLARLTQDPSYNVNLGATYLEGLLVRFSGSYIMSIAGYNAGGGRVTQWMDSFGDPRDGVIDPIDWVEMIPFNETRNYVQRVLANLQIYRARLNDGTYPLELQIDLVRGGN